MFLFNFCAQYIGESLCKVSLIQLHSPPTAVPVTVAAAAAAAAAVPPALAVGPAPTNVLWWTR